MADRATVQAPVDGVALSLDEVDFSFGSVQVLFGVSMQVREGESLALLGTNGAGKSTLLGVAAGLLRPQAGRVVLNGEDVTTLPAHRRAGAGLVLVPGGRAVFSDMSVSENLEMAAYLIRRDRSTLADRRAAVLELFPSVAARLRQQAGRLSGGEQQQLALAKAMMLDPAVLCIDELSLGLAPGVVEVLLEIVRGLVKRGTTIVLVEQSLNIAASICDRAIFLEKGEVRFEGPPADLLQRGDLARAVFLAEST